MTQEINLSEVFRYDPKTGFLIWRGDIPAKYFKTTRGYNTHLSQNAGKRAGYTHEATGHVYVNFGGKMRKAHRVIWEMHYGPIPDGMLIDHINMNGADNRLENLRLATKSQNGMNRRGNKGSKTGLKGVFLDTRDGMYQSEITVNRQRIYLGRYRTKGEAAVAYAKAALRYHGEFARV